MESIIIAGIGGAIILLAFKLAQSAEESSKFSDTQKAILFFTKFIFVFFYPIYVLFLIYNAIASTQKSENKQRRKLNTEIDKTDKIIYELKELYSSKLITQEEFNKKIDMLNTALDNQYLYSTKEYVSLKSLYEKNILSKEEFDAKFNILKLEKQKEKEESTPPPFPN